MFRMLRTLYDVFLNVRKKPINYIGMRDSNHVFGLSGWMVVRVGVLLGLLGIVYIYIYTTELKSLRKGAVTWAR